MLFLREKSEVNRCAVHLPKQLDGVSVGHVPPNLVLGHLMFTADPNALSNWAYTGGLNMSRVPSIDGATDNRLLYMVFLQISPDL